MRSLFIIALRFALRHPSRSHAATDKAPGGLRSIFNRTNLSNWLIPEADLHHGSPKSDATFSTASSLVQFRNSFIKALN